MCEFIEYLKLLSADKPMSTSCVPCEMLHPSQAQTPSVPLPARSPVLPALPGARLSRPVALRSPMFSCCPLRKGGLRLTPRWTLAVAWRARAALRPPWRPPFSLPHFTPRPALPAPPLLQILRLSQKLQNDFLCQHCE